MLVGYGYVLNDPPSRNAAALMARAGWRVTVFQTPPYVGVNQSTPPPGVEVYETPNPRLPESTGAFYRAARWLSFRSNLRHWIKINRPEIVVTIMLHPLAALPKAWYTRLQFCLISCVYDIPSLTDAGRLDRGIIKTGWRHLNKAQVVWASDVYKAGLAKEFGKLTQTPIVCHNCPTLDYLPQLEWPRDKWLRTELRRQGASIGETGGCILLRAGAAGEYGGILETLEVMRELPDDYVFVILGRPSFSYQKKLLGVINSLKLQRRAFIWVNSPDDIWKKALRGADIGHLIQGPFPPGKMKRLYDLNSSLSNNRLFQYMAAGLPIVSYDDPRMRAIYDEILCFRIVRQNDLQSDLQKVLEEMGVNSALRQELGIAARSAHVSRYNWENQFEKVLERFGTPS